MAMSALTFRAQLLSAVDQREYAVTLHAINLMQSRLFNRTISATLSLIYMRDSSQEGPGKQCASADSARVRRPDKLHLKTAKHSAPD